MDFKKFHKKTVLQVNKEITRLLGEWRNEINKISPKLLPLIDKFISSCQGGKGIRGLLVVLGYQLTSKLDNKNIIQVAAAYEIFHNAILAHDDIIDKSNKRRGKDSLYQALGGNHQAISQAICLADAGFFLALKVIAESKFEEKVKNQSLQWFCQVMQDTAAGQLLDIMTLEPIITAEYKTARYTIVGPLVLGAILGTGDQKLIKQLEMFGSNLGIAFQIKDDILDFESKIWGGVNLAKQTAEKYTNQTLEVLPKLTKDEEMSKILHQLVEYLLNRNK